jgi:hypothetical protein
MNSSVVLIDTVRLICKARPADAQLSLLWRKREETLCEAQSKCEYYYHPGKEAPVNIIATYRPKSRQGEDQFSMEFSWSKLLLGNNHQMIPDMPWAIEATDRLFAQAPGFPILPSIADMLLSRLDVCYNYFVGPLLPDYIAALSVLDYPHRNTRRINSQTVDFGNKSVNCKFYDKYEECGHEDAIGLLRHEATLQRSSTIRAALHLTGPIGLLDITPERCKGLLETDHTRLGILGRPFGSFNTALQALMDAYGPARATRLFGMLTLYQQYDRSEIAAKLGQSRNFVNRSLLDIRRAGIPLALTKSEYPLPPLEVEL